MQNDAARERTSGEPTILLVHGSWHFPVHYQRQLDLFSSHGYPTSCPQLPSFAALPPIGLVEDAKCIENELRNLVDDQEKDVIVTAHSYGGVVATQAVHADFGPAQRRSKGLKGGVIRLVYCAAFIPPLGESLGSALGGGPPPETKLPPFIPVDANGMCAMLNPAAVFYHDLPPSEQAHWVSLLKPCPAITQLQPVTYSAYVHHPVTYLVCENDNAVPQRKMLADVEKLYQGVRFEIETCEAGHSPFLSMPDVLVRVVEKILDKRS